MTEPAETLSADEIARFKRVGSGHVSDAMEMLGLRRAVIHGFRMLGADGAVMVGIAYTVTQGPKRHPAAAADALARHAEAARNANPGSVIVIDVGGRTDLGSWGENQALRAKAKGMAGVVINGCTRDIRGVGAIGLPTFCLGASPIKSRWDLETVAFNAPVVIGGVQIRAGDVLFGDEDGIVVVPAELRGEIIEKALQIHAKEEVRDAAPI